ncbi:MAG TPA: ectonucleotide pyrophosphatase/phosphodiesterase [Pyrinomonadaceae bacterium]
MKLKDSRIIAVIVALIALLHFALSPREVKQVSPARTQTTESSRAARRAIVISLDGLDVRYLRRADEFSLKIPTLRRLMKEGVLAGVESVYPSVTYPNHTAIVTGARPDRHRIVNNQVFVPPTSPQRGVQFWFARDIKTETLWDAARKRGLSTGLVSWPVSTGAGDWNVPEIWKPGTSPSDSFPTTLAEISRHARPAGLVEEIAERVPDIYKNVTKDEGDDHRAHWAEYIIREKRPDLMLVHLFDLDHTEHNRGPFTPEAFAILEKVDGYVGRILAAAEQAGTLSETAVFIVSDHGFRDLSKYIHPAVVLREAGLVTTRDERSANVQTQTVVTDWRAYPYPSGGSCAIVLRDAGDRDAAERARAALEKFNEQQGGKLFRIVGRDELSKLGAFPEAAFGLEATFGYAFGDNHSGEAITETTRRGTHGYLPMPADYRATLVVSGLDVVRRGDLGDVHMTEVGPTIAAALGLTLGDAQHGALKLR